MSIKNIEVYGWKKKKYIRIEAGHFLARIPGGVSFLSTFDG